MILIILSICVVSAIAAYLFEKKDVPKNMGDWDDTHKTDN